MIKNNKNINKYNFPGLNNTVGSRHADSIQFIFICFNENIKDCSMLFNIDSDMFIINKLNIKYLNILYDIIYYNDSKIENYKDIIKLFDVSL
jgi:hypothetical protein